MTAKFWKFRFRSKFPWKFSKYFNFVQNFIKFRIRSKFSKTFHFGTKSGKSRYRSKFKKNYILVRNFENLDFSQTFRLHSKISKISISVEISKNSNFVKKCENLDFVKKFRQSWFRSKFSKNSNFSHNFRQPQFRSKVSKDFDFGPNYFLKSRFRSNVSKNFYFGPKFQKSRFRLKFRKIAVQNFLKFWFRSNFLKNFNFGFKCRKFRWWSKFAKKMQHGSKIRKISIQVKMLTKIDFSPKFPKTRFSQKKLISVHNFWNSVFDPNFGKFCFGSEISENLISLKQKWFRKPWFRSKFSTSVKNFKYLECDKTFRKISISNSRKLTFCQKFRNILISVKKFENLDFDKKKLKIFYIRPKFRKILTAVKILISVRNFDNFDFGQNLRKGM